MATEIFVLSDRRLNSVAEWQHAINSERFPFPLRLSADLSLANLSGFLPAHYESAPSGFECDQWDSRSIADDYSDIVFGHPWKYALAFRFGIGHGELESAWMAATAYARSTGGVIFDTEEGRIFQPDEAAQLVRKIEQNRPLRAAIAEKFRQKIVPRS